MFPASLLLIGPALVIASVVINWHCICERKALKKLLKLYKANVRKGMMIGELPLAVRGHCPLCAVNDGKCRKCIWVKKTGKNCIHNSYRSILITDRIKQIEGWLEDSK